MRVNHRQNLTISRSLENYSKRIQLVAVRKQSFHQRDEKSRETEFIMGSLKRYPKTSFNLCHFFLRLEPEAQKLKGGAVACSDHAICKKKLFLG